MKNELGVSPVDITVLMIGVTIAVAVILYAIVLNYGTQTQVEEDYTHYCLCGWKGTLSDCNMVVVPELVYAYSYETESYTYVTKYFMVYSCPDCGAVVLKLPLG